MKTNVQEIIDIMAPSTIGYINKIFSYKELIDIQKKYTDPDFDFYYFVNEKLYKNSKISKHMPKTKIEQDIKCSHIVNYKIEYEVFQIVFEANWSIDYRSIIDHTKVDEFISYHMNRHYILMSTDVYKFIFEITRQEYYRKHPASAILDEILS